MSLNLDVFFHNLESYLTAIFPMNIPLILFVASFSFLIYMHSLPYSGFFFVYSSYKKAREIKRERERSLTSIDCTTTPPCTAATSSSSSARKSGRECRRVLSALLGRWPCLPTHSGFCCQSVSQSVPGFWFMRL
jgi:hypothetical protein